MSSPAWQPRPVTPDIASNWPSEPTGLPAWPPPTTPKSSPSKATPTDSKPAISAAPHQSPQPNNSPKGAFQSPLTRGGQFAEASKRGGIRSVNFQSQIKIRNDDSHAALPFGTVTVLITGGAGFIGSNLARALASRGESVRVFDDLSNGLESNLAGVQVEMIVGSVTCPKKVDEAMSNVSAVVHLAARGSVPRSIAQPLETHDVNVNGTLNVLEAARKAGAHVIYSSSSSVYGVNAALPKSEEMWMQPMSPYGASKLAAESYAMAYAHSYGVDMLALRFFNVYGPWQRPDHDYAAVIPRFAAKALRGEILEVHGDGNQTRDFTHVDAVVSVICDALRRRLSWDCPVNLAFGDRISVNDVVEFLRCSMGPSFEVRHGPARIGDIRDSQNYPGLLNKLFPSVTSIPFDIGMTSVLKWVEAQVMV
jgi:UDP-glucose 4-epimerase